MCVCVYKHMHNYIYGQNLKKGSDVPILSQMHNCCETTSYLYVGQNKK